MYKAQIGKSGYALSVSEDIPEKLKQELDEFLTTFDFSSEQEHGGYGTSPIEEILNIIPLHNLYIGKFVEYCKTREDFNMESKYILGEAYLDYIKQNEGL